MGTLKEKLWTWFITVVLGVVATVVVNGVINWLVSLIGLRKLFATAWKFIPIPNTLVWLIMIVLLIRLLRLHQCAKKIDPYVKKVYLCVSSFVSKQLERWKK